MKTFLLLITMICLCSCVSYVRSGNGIDLSRLNQLEPNKSKKESVLSALGPPDRIVTNNIEGTEVYLYERITVKTVAVGILPWALAGKKADSGYQISLGFKDNVYLGYTVSQFNQNLLSENDPERSFPFKKTAASGGCFEGYASTSEWAHEKQLKIVGFKGNAMEPEISADSNVLFFNDKPADDNNMQIHWASRDQKDSSGLTWNYRGLVHGASVENFLDGTPSVWQDPVTRKMYLYFVSIRTFDGRSNYGTIYSGEVQLDGEAKVLNPTLRDEEIQTKLPGHLNMDANVSADGKLALVSKARFSGKPYPDESALQLFALSKDGKIQVSPDLSALTEAVNNPACRTYAGNLSSNKLEMYYTALEAKGGNFKFNILVAKRSRADAPFKKGQIISAIRGELTEGPSISRDGKHLYYHQKAKDGALAIFRLER